MRTLLLLALAFCSVPACALASPGHGDDVEGATVDAGQTSAAIVYDRLTGGLESGADLVQLGVSHGASDRVRFGVNASFERDAGGTRRAESIGADATLSLGQAGPFSLAIFGAFDVGIGSPDTLEGRLIVQHNTGPVEARLNLIGVKSLSAGENLQLGYAASIEIAATPRLRLSLQGFGELGTFNRLLPHGGHAFGPSLGYDLGPGIELEAGYLFTLGKAREDTKGQVRIGLEFAL